ncbi:MAG: 1-acyl-sn-glycerol-3-phosphate acyltransferase [Leptospirales bacterium]|nr:1-acyl-sn-glycerol-3-phosphate acyltransferase [Leptospirales bacterium]
MDGNIKLKYTPYIMRGRGWRSLLLGRFSGFLFRKIAFENTSLELLKDYTGKGKIVFVSSQSHISSFFIFADLLRKHGFPVPAAALGFRLYVLQLLKVFLGSAYRAAASLLRMHKYIEVSDEEYVYNTLNEGKSLAISLLSKSLLLRRYVDVKIDFINDLVELQKKSGEPIFIFHQMMFWNQNPERSEPGISANATGDKGIIWGFFSTKKSVTPAFVKISNPINLKDEIEAFKGETSAVSDAVRAKLNVIYNNEKRAVLGPVVKTRYEMMEKVLLHKNVIDEINSICAAQKISEKKLRKRAVKYFDEIAADFSINYISMLARLLDIIFKKIFNGVSFDAEDFKKLREASEKGPLVIVPSHKSHIDYLIISWLFYKNKIIPPHVVAGINLNFLLVGHILRRAGALYMRRSFRGLDLYAVVFKQYVKTLVNEGYAIEFFIEGGRTRTGKLLFPKLGILKYLVESVIEDYSKDLIFVPVTINYDRVLEENSYSNELKGKEKKKENTVGFVKSSKSLLKRNYGRVRLSINSPISFNETQGKLADKSNETEDLAMLLARRINEITMITPFSLVTTAILFSGSKGFSFQALLERVSVLYDYLSFQKILMAPMLLEDGLEKSVQHVIDSYRKDSIIGLIKMSDVQTMSEKELEDILLLNEDERIRISFYRNTIIHYLVPVSFISIAVLNARNGNSVQPKKAEEVFENITSLFSKEFIYPDMVYKKGETQKILYPYLEKKGLIKLKSKTIAITEKGDKELLFYAKLTEDYLESYMIVFEAVLKMRGNHFTQKELLSAVREHGVRSYHLEIVKLSESLSISNYNNAISFLKNRGCLVDGQNNSEKPQMSLSNRDDVESCLRSVTEFLELMR